MIGIPTNRKFYILTASQFKVNHEKETNSLGYIIVYLTASMLLGNFTHN